MFNFKLYKKYMQFSPTAGNGKMYAFCSCFSSDSALPDAGAVEEIPLTGDFHFNPMGFNTNGIDATPNGKSLFIVNSATGLD